jgi:hypothetical protein
MSKRKFSLLRRREDFRAPCTAVDCRHRAPGGRDSR